MTDSLQILLSLIGGVALGFMYFYGLWWTIGRFRHVTNAAAFYMLSVLLRIGILMGCLAFMLHIGVLSMLAGLFGFFSARFLMMRVIGNKATTETGQVS